MTIYDISEKAGVSIATVSRVLNGSGSVSAKTKEKVLAVVEEYGYTPNLFARGLGLNSMNTIGILCVDSSDIFLAKAVYYIEENLHDNGYDSLLCCTGYNQKDKEEALNLLISKKVDACIMVGSSLVGQTDAENKYLKEAAKKIPIMLLNAYIDAPNVYSVLADDYLAIYQVTNQMYQSGIHDILYYYNSNSYSGRLKLAGFRDAMRANGVEESGQLTSYYAGNREDITAITEGLIELHEQGVRFHGLISSDDNMAISAVKFAKIMNLSISKDLSIVGYNNSLLAKCCEPELTSVDNHLEVLCRNLTSTLVDVLEGKKVSQRAVFSCELVQRGTTSFPD
ncbi:MAG TPA: LacI family DNA-binding transcriptional regulator [Lachnospiraceae bacterium]|nr:LacI family DNA-binding transcriptional regulator [Lachnospiraceae bacterium]